MIIKEFRCQTKPKDPKDYPVVKVPDIIWVAGDNKFWAKFRLLVKDADQKTGLDIFITAAPNPKATEYVLPSVIRGSPATVGWGISKVNGSPCKQAIFERTSAALKNFRRIKKADMGNNLIAYDKEMAKDNTIIADNARLTKSLIITRYQESALVNFSQDAKGDTLLNVLVGSVQIGSFGKVKAGSRYSSLTKTIEKIDPRIMAKLPSVERFLDKTNWSIDINPLIDEFNQQLNNSLNNNLNSTIQKFYNPKGSLDNGGKEPTKKKQRNRNKKKNH